MKTSIALATLLVFGASAVTATAATSPVTATFQVKMTIQKACTVTAGSGSDIDLGTVDSTAVDTSSSNTISVTCSNTTPYYVGLAPSNANTAGAGTMAGTSGDNVPYQLYSDAGTTIWGNTATSTAVGNGVAGTGTGSAQSLTVYATAPSANFTPGDYADTVTVNVNF
jgi:spore coat protein U-like protein